MKIGIDIRSLLAPRLTGVGEYTYRLLNGLFQVDSANEYLLFFNACRAPEHFDVIVQNWTTRYPNVLLKEFHCPNKFFNLGLKFLHQPKIDRLLGKIDVFFAPNINFLALSDNCPLILTIHDLSFEIFPQFFSSKQRLWHSFINVRRLCQRADRIIAVSQNTKNDLVNYYQIDPSKIRVIYSGIPLDFTSPTEKEAVRKKYQLPEKYILFLGTLEPRKNIIGLIQAFELLKENNKIEHHLVIAGSPGWQAEKIYQCAKKSKAAEQIHFLGYIPPENKLGLYQASSLFVYPSFYEGFGFPVLEAMSCSLAVIASACAALPEITAGGAPLLINPFRPAEIAGAMEQCLTNPPFATALGEKNKKHAAAFNWQKCSQSTLEILNSTVS